MQEQGISKQEPLSLLVILRNEAHNLPSFFEDLKALDYPIDKFEILFWNDASDDSSAALIDSFKANNTHLHIDVIHEPKAMGKKKIIQAAVMRAKYDWILLSDADVRFSANRLNAFSAHLSNQIDFAIGEVQLLGDSFFQKLQSLEYATLMAVARASSNSGHPIMGSSANLIFRKSAFLQCMPYQSNMDIPSGDDIFLINSLKKLRKVNSKFISGRDVLVRTGAHQSLKKSIIQRLRWAGKNIQVGDPVYLTVSLLTLLVNVLCIPIFIHWLSHPESFHVALMAFGLKLVAEFLFYRRMLLPQGIGLTHFLCLSLLYPLYVTFIGLLSFVIRPRWK